MIGTLFGSDHNDDPKLLTFSDSVQDAAHRAGVFQALNASNVMRAGLSRFVCQEVAPDLAEIEARVPAAMKKEVGAGDPEFVATYLPADMEWRREYVELVDTDALPATPTLPGYLAERLAWDSFAELTFRSRLGATVERTGLVAPHADRGLIEAVAGDLVARMPSELGVKADLIDTDDVRRFVAGLVDHMRARGAVATDVTRTYVEREANWVAVLKTNPKGLSLPRYAPRAPKPTFPSNRSLQGFESIATDSLGSWYVPWFQKCFEPMLVLTGELHRDLYQLLFRIMEHKGLVERMPVGRARTLRQAAPGGCSPKG